jgi:hypothetical protein
MQPIRQAVSPGALLGIEVAPTQAQARARSQAPALALRVDNNPHHQQQARREGCGAMAAATSNASADAVPASLFTSTTFEKDVSIFVDDEIGAASISPSGRDVVLARQVFQFPLVSSSVKVSSLSGHLLLAGRRSLVLNTQHHA